jgi:Novel STAND NTPase 1
MSLSGGAADKLGNRYELLWTIRCMAQVLAGEAETIRLEPPGEEGRGIEFILTKDGRHEFHQVKRQQAGKGHWSIANLSGILRNFRAHLEREPNALCVFVSQEATKGLSELTERARSSASNEELEHEFLKSEDLQCHFIDLCKRWDGCGLPTAWALLRRIEVHTLDERNLDAFASSLLDPLVQGDPRAVGNALIRHALDMVHQTLDGNALWAHLSGLDHGPTDWGRDKSVAAAVREEAERYLTNAVSPITRIMRAETDTVIAAFTGSLTPARVAFLTGEAGSGKSEVAAQVVEGIRALGWPVFAFRVDRLEPVSRPEELAPGLGLPGSPAAVLAAVARSADSLLVVDQLDSVSTVSGRSPQFFHCFEELLRQTSAHAHLRVLVVCRSFDLEHDHRLRQLRSQYQTSPVISVGRLSAESVRQAVTELGVVASGLNRQQVELLSLPLHLVLLAETIAGGASSALNFATAFDLYDGFWRSKQQRIYERRGETVRWTEPISLLCDTMSRDQALSVPWDRLLEFEQDANAMVSEHVLKRDGRRVSFFHEGFFDYAFARLFVGRARRLADLVLDGEQHLFRRAQVRQVILYRRASGDKACFLRDLRWVLTSEGVRLHLRQTGFLVLAGLPDPFEEEWQLVQYLMASRCHRIANWARKVVVGSVGWLRLLHENGTLGAWLRESGPNRDLALQVLHRWVEDEPERVAALLGHYVEGGEDWHKRIWRIVGWHGAIIRSEQGWQMIRRLITVSEPDPDFYHASRNAAPERCCEALALHLLQVAETNAEALGHAQQQRDLPLKELAEAIPAVFMDHMRDLILNLVQRLSASRTSDDLPHPDGLGWRGVSKHGEAFLLFEGAALALGRLASQDAQAFRRHLSVLAATDWETAHLIVLKAFLQADRSVASDIASYLVDIFMRYSIGDEESLLWTVRDAMSVMAPYWNETEFAALEALIFEVSPKWERSCNGYKTRGRAQRLLLEALPDERLSERARRRLQEWRRKANIVSERPWVVRGGVVQSPLPATATQVMNDRQWLRAIDRYADDTEKAYLENEILGGARQLSGVLQGLVKSQPVRFAHLCLILPPETNPCYFDAILLGLAETEYELDADVMVSVLRRCHMVEGRPCGRWIARILQRNAECNLSEEAIDILCWYGLNDPDPTSDLWREDAGSGGRWYGGNILDHGINTVRGAVAEAVAALLFVHPRLIGRLMPVAQRLIDDPTIAVRALSAEICTALLKHDPPRGLRLFECLVDCDDDLLGTYMVERFLRYTLRGHFAIVEPILERMLVSAHVTVAQAGARLVCIASLDLPEAERLAAAALTGEMPLRLGAAQVYSANVLSHRLACEAALHRLFEDLEQEVRSAAVHFLHDLPAEDLATIAPLLEVLIDSPAYVEGADGILDLLERTPGHMPALLLAAVERFLALSGSGVADRSTGTAVSASTAADLLIRSYSQSEDEDLRGRCLDLIDELIGLEAFGVERALERVNR